MSLYLSYLKTAVVAMLWAAAALSAYALIRTNPVAQVVAAGAVSLVISLVIALPVIDRLSTSHRIRKTAAALFETLRASLRSEPRTSQKQRV